MVSWAFSLDATQLIVFIKIPGSLVFRGFSFAGLYDAMLATTV